MDLLFREYASPFSLLDALIASENFLDWIDQFLESHKEKVQWELWLNKIYDKSWSDFVGGNEVDQATANMTRSEVETTINDSYQIIMNITPDDEWKGGE